MVPRYLTLSPRALRGMRGLSERTLDQIAVCIDRYNSDPTGRPVKKLRGTDPAMWSLRCGDYRIIFSVRTGDIELIGHRRDVYRMLGR